MTRCHRSRGERRARERGHSPRCAGPGAGARRRRDVIGTRLRDTAQWVDHAIYVNGGQVRVFVNGAAAVGLTSIARRHCRARASCASAPGDDASTTRPAARDRDPRAARLVPRDRSRRRRRRCASASTSSATSSSPRASPSATSTATATSTSSPARPGSRRRAGGRTSSGRSQSFSIHRGYSDSFIDFALDVNRDGWVDVMQFDFPGRAGYWYENPQGRSGRVDATSGTSRPWRASRR